MSGVVLAISDNQEAINKIATVFEFIDYNLKLIEDLNLAKAALDTETQYLITLIMIVDDNEQKNMIALLNKKAPAVPVYILKTEETLKSSSSTIKGTTGNIQFPVQYRNLLGIIRQAENDRKGSRSPRGFSSSLTGESPQLKKIEALVRHVSMTDANVLLMGESGTGKEVVARGIHQLSLRTDRPFVAVNCGAIPPELLESELFGHEKGSFTGAINMRRGRFELAEGGTLFLDEIGDMPMPMQVKLLRVIQERTFERVGGTKTITSNVRLIAATHQDLEKRIGEGEFRMDLFYRLNVFPIELSPIRERPGDIPLLIKEFSTRMELDKRSPISFHESAIKALCQHPLPGNVRELENLVERLAILYPGETITHEKLPQRYQLQDSLVHEPSEPTVMVRNSNTSKYNPLPIPETEDGINLKNYLSSMEKMLIQQALENSDWVVAKAAKSLSLQRTTLVEKIRKLEIQS